MTHPKPSFIIAVIVAIAALIAVWKQLPIINRTVAPSQEHGNAITPSVASYLSVGESVDRHRQKASAPRATEVGKLSRVEVLSTHEGRTCPLSYVAVKIDLHGPSAGYVRTIEYVAASGPIPLLQGERIGAASVSVTEMIGATTARPYVIHGSVHEGTDQAGIVVGAQVLVPIGLNLRCGEGNCMKGTSVSPLVAKMGVCLDPHRRIPLYGWVEQLSEDAGFLFPSEERFMNDGIHFTIARVDGSAIGYSSLAEAGPCSTMRNIDWLPVGSLECKARGEVSGGCYAMYLESDDSDVVIRRIVDAAMEVCSFRWIPAGEWVLTICGPSIETCKVPIVIRSDEVVKCEMPLRPATTIREVVCSARLESGDVLPSEVQLSLSDEATPEIVYRLSLGSPSSQERSVERVLRVARNSSYRVELSSPEGIVWSGSPSKILEDTQRIEFVGLDAQSIRILRLHLEKANGHSLEKSWRVSIVTTSGGDSIGGRTWTDSIELRDVSISTGMCIAVASDAREFQPFMLSYQEVVDTVSVDGEGTKNVVVTSPPLGIIVRLVDQYNVGVESIRIACSDRTLETDRYGCIELGRSDLGGTVSMIGYRVIECDSEPCDRISLEGIDVGDFVTIEVSSTLK